MKPFGAVRKLMSMLLTFRVLLLALLPLQSGAAPLEPAQVVDALEPAWRVPMTISKDGQRVAYCVMQPSKKQPMLAQKYYRSQSGVFAETVGTDIYLADAEGRLSNLTQARTLRPFSVPMAKDWPLFPIAMG